MHVCVLSQAHLSQPAVLLIIEDRHQRVLCMLASVCLQLLSSRCTVSKLGNRMAGAQRAVVVIAVAPLVDVHAGGCDGDSG